MGAASKTERFELRLDPGILDELDTWRSRQPDIPSRAEAVRRLMEAGLATPSETEITLSDGEKLITLMLCELFKHLKLQNGLDASFVEDAIQRGQLWALGWQYPGVFHGSEASKTTRHEVLEILEMWSCLERGHARLTRKDKDRIAADGAPFGKHVVFSGFDGNHESEYLGVAAFLINKLDRFSEFKGRDLNSHFPFLTAYRRMARVFEPMREDLIGRELTASQIGEILKSSGHQAVDS